MTPPKANKIKTHKIKTHKIKINKTQAKPFALPTFNNKAKYGC